MANPLHSPVWEGVTPLAYPEITLLSPAENNTLLNSTNATITVNAAIDSGKVSARTEAGIFPTYVTVDFTAEIEQIYYQPSWQKNNTTLTFVDYSDLSNVSCSINLTEIPEGNQTLMITVTALGYYSGYKKVTPQYPEDPTSIPVCYNFEAASNCTIGFTVDTVSPRVTILGLNNMIFSGPDAPLSFSVNEAVSRMTYSLDRKENVTITGNTTLTGIAGGDHSLTVYVMDKAGNTGSETAYFHIPLFPTSLVAGSAITVAAVAVGLFVFFKKRQRGKTE